MSYDLVIRFDTLADIASRLDREQDSLSASPTDCLVSPQSATAGFPEAFNGALADLAAARSTLVEDIATVSDGVRGPPGTSPPWRRMWPPPRGGLSR